MERALKAEKTEPGYQTDGMSRKRTLPQYPHSPAGCAQESLLVEQPPDQPATIGMSTSSPQYDPSASGVKPSINSAPEYIGWRTTA